MKNKMNPFSIYSALIAMWFGHFLVDMMIGFWSVYKCIAKLDLGICGLIAGISALIGESTQILFGIMGDKGYRKQILIFGLLASASSATLAYTNNYLVLFGIILLTAIGSGAFHPSAAAVVSNLSENRKGLFITIFACGGSFGIASSQLIFSSTYNYFKDNMFFLAVPAIFLIIVISFLVLPSKLQTANKNYQGFKGLKSFFERKDLSRLYFSQVCNQSVVWGMIFLLPDVSYTRGYADWLSFGGAHLFYILGGAVMLVPSGIIADYFSSKTVLITAIIVGIILFYSFLLGPTLTIPPLLILLFTLGAVQGVLNPVSLAWGYRLLPEAPGLVSAALMGLVWCFSEFIGLGGSGFISTFFKEDAPAKALAILGSLYFISLFLIFLIPNDKKVQNELESVT